MSKANKPKLWAVFGNEEKPVALLFAVTEFGAKMKYENMTGRSRHGIYVERVFFEEGFYPFVSAE